MMTNKTVKNHRLFLVLRLTMMLPFSDKIQLKDKPSCVHNGWRW